MTKTMEPVTIATIKEVQLLFTNPISESKASRFINQAKDAMDVKILTMDMFCTYWGLK